jgi:hypothetical protein
MSDFIYNPTSVFTNIKPEDSNVEEQFFTLVGFEDFIDSVGLAKLTNENNEKVFAKQISRKDGTTKFMIRLASNGKLFNPLSIYGVEQDNSFLNRVCRSNKKFREVNQKTFDWYLKFLNTKNIGWLNNAEREME